MPGWLITVIAVAAAVLAAAGAGLLRRPGRAGPRPPAPEAPPRLGRRFWRRLPFRRPPDAESRPPETVLATRPPPDPPAPWPAGEPSSGEPPTAEMPPAPLGDPGGSPPPAPPSPQPSSPAPPGPFPQGPGLGSGGGAPGSDPPGTDRGGSGYDEAGDVPGDDQGYGGPATRDGDQAGDVPGSNQGFGIPDSAGGGGRDGRRGSRDYVARTGRQTVLHDEWDLELPDYYRERPGPASPSPGPLEPPVTPSRYANASLRTVPLGDSVPRDQPLETDRLLQLRLSIGPQAADSQVEAPVPFPDEYLPPGDLTVDVVVTSDSFWVGPGNRSEPGAWGHAQQDRFILPGDGRAARTEDGRDELIFELLTPHDPGTARLRIVYYYRGAVLQSQVLLADIGNVGVTGRYWSLLTDYTIAEFLPAAAGIPDRSRVAVVLHEDASGQAIYTRRRDQAAGEPGAGSQARGAPGIRPASDEPATVIEVPPALADRVRTLRQLLAGEPVAPTALRQTKAQLIRALRTLAPIGWELYAALFPSMRETFYELDQQAGPAVLHVARTSGVSLSVPWALLYTIGLDSGLAASQYRSVPLCPLIDSWDGAGPLVNDGLYDLAACPHAAAVPHTSNLLCPFGFLGLRHDIEQLTWSQRPVLSIPAAAGARMVIAETAYQVSKQALDAHVTALRQMFRSRLPGVSCLEATSKAELAELISRDLPLVYFYCHGERPSAASKETYLGIGAREWVTAADFTNWVQEAYQRSRLRVWDQVRPLVFINACHSAELDPRALFNYVDAFVGVGNAAGVIGTEVRVHQDLAMRFAQVFFDGLLAEGGTVGTALRRARLAFLAEGNLFGLNYTPYCWSDLAVTGPAPGLFV